MHNCTCAYEMFFTIAWKEQKFVAEGVSKIQKISFMLKLFHQLRLLNQGENLY